MSPVEPCPNPYCRLLRHRWATDEWPHTWEEYASQLCMRCRLNMVANESDSAEVEIEEEQ